MIDPQEHIKKIEEIISSALKYSEEISQTGEFFDAGEFLFSISTMVEEISYYESLKLYERIISLWGNQIDKYRMLGKWHEISELHLRISEIYAEKFKDYKREKKHILRCIRFLRQECKIMEEFNEGRKLAQNYQNIAELYLKISNFGKAIKYYEKVIKYAKILNFYDLLSYSYRQISFSYEELDDYRLSQEILLEAIDYFTDLFQAFEKKNENLALSQLSQILKNIYKDLDNEKQYVNYSKKEAGAYINIAEELVKKKKNYYKIARYYRGAALCYKSIENNLIESASCFVLAGNYSEKMDDFNQTGINYFDAAKMFKKLNNPDMAYKHFMKAGDNFWKIKEHSKSTESYLYAYDIAMEAKLEFNRFGLFNQIVRGLNIIAKEGLKNKQFYTAATLILESVKFYEQLDTAKDFLLREMIKNTYKYYYRAANLKKIGYSHIVHSYIVAALSLILIGQCDKAKEIVSEIKSNGETVNLLKSLITTLIKWVSEGKKVELDKLPFKMRRIVERSEDIKYLLELFKRI
ncbi:MAG: hypothetical protein GF317_22670 [Candidatus Lokiarchaeota archaeon]|nr:hypothetical protein [Candidatus Lokiarchaeota archaeon]MBD3202270.1 hypothetical protein [Candidatus Lokiarchaeota archaeon]